MNDEAARKATRDAHPQTKVKRRGAQPIADLIGGVLGPAARRRGFASVDLFAYWPDIVGASFADYTQPERLIWPKRLDTGGEAAFEPATLTVRCEGSRALLFQYEAPAVVERINAIFGFRAVARLKIVQMPIIHMGMPVPPKIAPLGEPQERALRAGVAGVDDEALRDALIRLGRAVKGRKARTGTGHKQM
jgi:hypothetical protein